MSSPTTIPPTPQAWAQLLAAEVERIGRTRCGYQDARAALTALVSRAHEFAIPLRQAGAEVNSFLRGTFPADHCHLVVVGADKFMARVFPPRQILLSPFFEDKNLGMLFAPRGTGKTLVAAGIALAVSAGGKFLNWEAPEPRCVLYVDGELPQETLQKRILDVSASAGLRATDNLRLLTPDLQPDGVHIPDLGEEKGQRRLLDLIEEEAADLVILDNLSTLCRSGVENEAERWQPIQDWLQLLRSRRRSVLMLHHTDKARGDQRGTSKREDVLDFSIKLSRPEKYQMEEGARFEVHFVKARDIAGRSVTPFEARLVDGRWEVADLSETAKEDRSQKAELARVIALAPEVEAHLARAPGSTMTAVATALEARKKDASAALRGLEAQKVAAWVPGPKGAQLWSLTTR